MEKGQFEKAKMSLLSLRGSQYNMDPELKELEDLVKAQQENSNWIDKFKKFKSRSNVIPFTIMAIIFFIQVIVKQSTYLCIKIG